MKRLNLLPVLLLGLPFSPGNAAADEYPKLQLNAVSVAVVDLRLLSHVEHLPSGLQDLWLELLPPSETDPLVDGLRHMHANVIALHGMNMETQCRLREELRLDYPFSVWTRTVDGARVAFLSRRLLDYPVVDGSYEKHTVRANMLVGDRFIRLVSAEPRSPLFLRHATPEDPDCTADGDCIVLTSKLRPCLCGRYSYYRPEPIPALRDRHLSSGDAGLHAGQQDALGLRERKLRSLSQLARSPNPAAEGAQSCVDCRDRGFSIGPCERCGRNEEIFFSDSLNVRSSSLVRIDLVDPWDKDHVYSRPIPVATLAFKPNPRDALRSPSFGFDEAGEEGGGAFAETSRPDAWPARIGLPYP